MRYAWTIVVLGACHCAENSLPGSRRPSDGGVSLDGSDGSPGSQADAQHDAACVSEFQVSPTCVHPVVRAQCANGFCTIPAGCFVMGSPQCQLGRGVYDEPETEVSLSQEFEIGATEVTQGDWISAGLANPSHPPDPGRPQTYGTCMSSDCPVGFTSWFDAIAFTNALSDKRGLERCYELEGCTGTVGIDLMCTGAHSTHPSQYDCRGYRLPTDAEWEYAARAGTRTPYYTGSMIGVPNISVCTPAPNLLDIAWFCANVSDLTSRPVRQKLPNAWGLYDMLGNVSEWTSSAALNAGYPKGPIRDFGAALEPDRERPIRGGNLGSLPSRAAVSNRVTLMPNVRVSGLRVVRSLFPPNAVNDAGSD